MGSSRILVAVLVGLLSTVWTHYCSEGSPATIQEESWIGLLSWTILYIGCLYFSCIRQSALAPSYTKKSADGRLWLKWLTAVGLSTAATVAQIARGQGILTPATPIVTLATFLSVAATSASQDRHHLLETAQVTREQEFQEPCWLDKSTTSLRIPLRIPVNILLALLLVGSGSYPNHLLSVAGAASVVFVAAQTVILTAISKLSRKDRSPSPATQNLLDWDLLAKISFCSTATFTCLLIYSTSILTFSLPSLLSVSRAVGDSALWVSMFILCSEKLPVTATTFDTVATSFGMIVSNGGNLGLLAASTACVVSLWQSVTDVPRGTKSRNWLYLLIAIPLWSHGYSRHHQLIQSEQQDLMLNTHPVEAIVQHARKEFADLVHAQSKTVEQARIEYTKRYRRAPPQNFEKWFDLAVQNDFVLVDEFDSIMRAFEPFYGVAPSVLQSLVKNACEQSSSFLVEYQVLNQETTITGGGGSSWFGGSMSQLLPTEWAALLPNMTLAINVSDEPSVSVPRDILDRVLRPSKPKDSSLDSSLKVMKPDLSHSPKFLNIGKQDAWEAMTLSCPADSPARNSFCASPTPEAGPEFVRNLSRSKNVCEHCELQALEGFFMAPETLHLTHSLVPIWSQARPSSLNDIVFPSPYYLGRSSDYNEAEDIEWKDKASQLYWVGAATGGHTTESNWKQMQRQRMVLMTQSDSKKSIQLLNQTEKGVWRPYTSNISEISSLFSTRIMGVTGQCDSPACEAQKQAFGIGDQELKDPPSAPYKHKFALDVDGNSFSGRFYRLLQSKSMVVKQTVFEEWHDDRLIPWIHYIPVSTSLDELPELVRFLATTERGEEIAARIAHESRDWAGKVLRPVDMQLVWLRMLLEYGRIMNSDRDI